MSLEMHVLSMQSSTNRCDFRCADYPGTCSEFRTCSNGRR